MAENGLSVNKHNQLVSTHEVGNPTEGFYNFELTSNLRSLVLLRAQHPTNTADCAYFELSPAQADQLADALWSHADYASTGKIASEEDGE